MQAPKRKTSKSRRGTRRAHDFITAKGTSICANCDEIILPHTVCKACGFYRGRKIANV